MYILGLEKIRAEFESWDWRFGKTPKFSVSRTFPLPETIRGKGEEELTVKVEVEGGLVQDVIFHIPTSLMMSDGLVDDIKVPYCIFIVAAIFFINMLFLTCLYIVIVNLSINFIIHDTDNVSKI